MLLKEHIEKMQAPENINENNPLYVQYVSIKSRYIEKKLRSEIAKDLNLGLRSYDRMHTEAITRLGRLLAQSEINAESELRKQSRIEAQHNLPSREQYVSRLDYEEKILSALDRKKRHWIVHVYGVGGMGKTSLTLEMVYRCLEKKWFDGAIWIDARTHRLTQRTIVEVAKPILSIEAIYDKIGEVVDPSILKIPFEEKAQRVYSALEKGFYLIIIDNFETIPLEIQKTLIQFLTETNNFPSTCKAIVTSRNLESRDPEVEITGKQVRVRGMEVNETLEFIHNITDDLDPNPIKFAPEELLEELRVATDGSPLAMRWLIRNTNTQRKSLRSMIDDLHALDKNILLEYCFGQAYKPLTESNKNILKLLSLFPEPISESAINAILGMRPEETAKAVDLLWSGSLIQNNNNDDYHTILQLTREFLKLDIDDSFRNRVFSKAVQYYQDFVTRNRKNPKRLKLERDNIFAVLQWCIPNQKLSEFVDIVNNLAQFLFDAGYWNDLRNFAKFAADASRAMGNNEMEVTFLVAHLGYLHYAYREYDLAMEVVEKGLKLAERNHLIKETGLAYKTLGQIFREQGNLPESKRHFELSIQIMKQFGDTDSLNQIRGNLTSVLRRMKDFDGAEQILQEQLEEATVNEDEVDISIATCRLGTLAYEKRDYSLARTHFLASVEIDERLGRLNSLAFNYKKLANTEKDDNNPLLAYEYAKKARDTFSVAGSPKDITEMDMLIVDLEHVLQGEQ